MAAGTEVKVPDIGDFKNVEVIEVLVKPGDAVSKEQSLITLESDKATMEIPSPGPGVVKELRIKVGDKVSQGSPILLLEGGEARNEAPSRPKVPEAPRPSVPPPATGADIECEVVVLGAGPGGYSAAFRAADLGLKTVLVERYPSLGGVCLNVGCIPSKALLHVARVIDEVDEVSHFGVAFGKPSLDVDKLRGWKESVVKKLTGGLGQLAKQRKVAVVTGFAQFLDPHHVEVSAGDKKQVVRFDQCIIAVGSRPVKLPFLPPDPRIIDSTGALELQGVPDKMLVIGGGIIGMEMAQVYASLGARITVVELLPQLMTGADPDLVRPLARRVAKRYESVLLQTKVVRAEAATDGVHVWFEGKNAPSEPRTYDRVLVAVGRVPNGKTLAADKAGVRVTEQGFIPADNQLH